MRKWSEKSRQRTDQTIDRLADSLTREQPLSGAHTPGAVSARARKLGLTSYAQTWSAEQDELLRAGDHHIGEGGRSRHGADARSGLRWARSEDVVLTENPGMQPGVLARRLGRSDHAVRRRQRLLGLGTGSRSPQYAPARGAMSPAEERLIFRELNVDAEKSGRRLLALADRLGRSPAELRQRIRAVGAAS